MMRRFVSMTALGACLACVEIVSGGASRHTPPEHPQLSCEACISSVQTLLSEWSLLEPRLHEELPALVCSSSPLPASCRELVEETLQHLEAVVNNTSAQDVCEEVGVCNFTAAKSRLLMI